MCPLRVAHSGGCTIGTRPIDIHIDALSSLGVSFSTKKDCDCFDRCSSLIVADGYTKGGHVLLKYPSVGATENIMIAASTCEEKTVIMNAACEPEIVDLQEFLKKCGVCITGAGTSVITIYGTKKLNTYVEHDIIPDRIEACTYLTAGCLIGKNIKIAKCSPRDLSMLLKIIRVCGADAEYEKDNIIIRKRITESMLENPMFIRTGPHPMAATDMQPFLTVITACTGCFCAIEETVFANRFRHINELCKMGANLSVNGNFILCGGAANLRGTVVNSSDLRCGAALIVAGLCACGTSVVDDPCDFIMRGYSNPEKKLAAVGAKIVKI